MRKARWIALAALPAVLTAPLWGPRALERTPWFRVQRVEVAGTRMVAPHEVLTASGIRLGASVWADPSDWEARLRRTPGIEEARVVRRLPGTLRIEVREKRTVGLVEAGTLHLLTAAGEVLPLDPAGEAVDLPLIRARVAAKGAVDARTRALAAELGRLEELDPGLLARVSEVEWGGADAVLLAVSAPEARVLLPVGAESTRLRQLRAALDDVARRAPAAPDSAGTAPPVRIDLRFQDQVVVRFPSRA